MAPLIVNNFNLSYNMGIIAGIFITMFKVLLPTWTHHSFHLLLQMMTTTLILMMVLVLDAFGYILSIGVYTNTLLWLNFSLVLRDVKTVFPNIPTIFRYQTLRGVMVIPEMKFTKFWYRNLGNVTVIPVIKFSFSDGKNYGV